ncbi:hypothetical protein B0H16DRAFT_1482040 [Mycena metata]|uniref:Bacteriophage T5 Orf172 DNA-binding domain-containing protein n=1 Tax=Mycena metata TaxID=1033252 RepID=A0AAD7GV32_9AGAR|nr:hypothetical protein B0H16DRAFT_1482040 [Mycena metata]
MVLKANAKQDRAKTIIATYTPHTMPLSLAEALAAVISPKDCKGFIYIYFGNYKGRTYAKIGYTTRLEERPGEWARQCFPEQHEWMHVAIEVEYCKKMEKIVHAWGSEKKGAWLGRVPCRYCHKKHIEKFDLQRLGGIDEIVDTVIDYTQSLGWKFAISLTVGAEGQTRTAMRQQWPQTPRTSLEPTTQQPQDFCAGTSRRLLADSSLSQFDPRCATNDYPQHVEADVRHSAVTSGNGPTIGRTSISDHCEGADRDLTVESRQYVA